MDRADRRRQRLQCGMTALVTTGLGPLLCQLEELCNDLQIAAVVVMASVLEDGADNRPV